nr:ABC transporter permease [Synergistaceae bacterium]
LIGAEILAASSGLGFLILEAEQMGRSDRILLGVIIIGILGSMMDYTLRIGIRRIAPWIE